MNNMSLSDYANIISALAAALSLLAPIMFTWISQRARLGNTEHYIESLKLNNELKQLLLKYPRKTDPLIHNRIKTMIRELSLDINRRSRIQVSMRPYNVTLFFEILLFMTIWLSGTSKWLTMIFEAQSNETGIGFFEGILSAPAVRVMIVILNVLAAAFINRYIMRLFHHRTSSGLILNVSAILLFHLVAFATLAFTYMSLSILDGYFSSF